MCCIGEGEIGRTPVRRSKTLIFRRERARPIILDGRYARSGGSYIQPAENEAGLRIAWNNTWWTMALSPCHADRPALGTASAAATYADAESTGPEDTPGILRARASARQSAPTIDQSDDPI